MYKTQFLQTGGLAVGQVFCFRFRFSVYLGLDKRRLRRLLSARLFLDRSFFLQLYQLVDNCFGFVFFFSFLICRLREVVLEGYGEFRFWWSWWVRSGVRGLQKFTVVGFFYVFLEVRSLSFDVYRFFFRQKVGFVESYLGVIVVLRILGRVGFQVLLYLGVVV